MLQSSKFWVTQQLIRCKANHWVFLSSWCINISNPARLLFSWRFREESNEMKTWSHQILCVDKRFRVFSKLRKTNSWYPDVKIHFCALMNHGKKAMEQKIVLMRWFPNAFGKIQWKSLVLITLFPSTLFGGKYFNLYGLLKQQCQCELACPWWKLPSSVPRLSWPLSCIPSTESLSPWSCALPPDAYPSNLLRVVGRLTLELPSSVISLSVHNLWLSWKV